MAMAQNNSNFLQEGAFVSSTVPQSLANSGGKPSLNNTINNQALSNTLKQVNKRSYSVDRNSKIHSSGNDYQINNRGLTGPGVLRAINGYDGQVSNQSDESGFKYQIYRNLENRGNGQGIAAMNFHQGQMPRS